MRLFLMVLALSIVPSICAADENSKQAEDNGLSREIVSSGPETKSCSASIAAAYQRCAAMCGSAGVAVFSPGNCGSGATCICGGVGGLPTPPRPIEN